MLNLRSIFTRYLTSLSLLGVLLMSVSLPAAAESMPSKSHTTVIVTFPLGETISLDMAKSMFEASAPTYKKIPGLIRKYYLYGEGPMGGGVYLWESKEAAEQLYTKAWRDRLAERVGAQPSVQYFSSPVIVDNTK